MSGAHIAIKRKQHKPVLHAEGVHVQHAGVRVARDAVHLHVEPVSLLLEHVALGADVLELVRQRLHAVLQTLALRATQGASAGEGLPAGADGPGSHLLPGPLQLLDQTFALVRGKVPGAHLVAPHPLLGDGHAQELWRATERAGLTASGGGVGMLRRHLVVALNLQQPLLQFLHLLGKAVVLVSAVSQQLSQTDLKSSKTKRRPGGRASPMTDRRPERTCLRFSGGREGSPSCPRGQRTVNAPQETRGDNKGSTGAWGQRPERPCKRPSLRSARCTSS